MRNVSLILSLVFLANTALAATGKAKCLVLNPQQDPARSISKVILQSDSQVLLVSQEKGKTSPEFILAFGETKTEKNQLRFFGKTDQSLVQIKIASNESQLNLDRTSYKLNCL